MSLPTALEQQIIDDVNADRAAHGLKPLTINPQLEDAAHSHTNWMASAGQLSHTESDGSDRGARITAAGYHALTWGENVAMRSGALDAAAADGLNQQWINSAPHHSNMLNPNFTQIGVAMASDGHGRVWATEDFAAPAAGGTGSAPPPPTQDGSGGAPHNDPETPAAPGGFGWTPGWFHHHASDFLPLPDATHRLLHESFLLS